MSTQNTENAQNQNENNNKVAVSYGKNMRKLAALLGGEKNVKLATKVKKDNVQEMVAGLFKEENDALITETKAEIKTLIKTKLEFDKTVKLKEQELEKIKTEKMKEFNEKAVKLFNKIEGIDSIEQEFAGVLTQAVEAADNAENKA